jgi:hypothetical protein
MVMVASALDDKVARALEAFLGTDPASVPYPYDRFVELTGELLQPLVQVYGINNTETVRVEGPAVRARAKALALALVDLVYHEPGTLASEHQWRQVGEATVGCLQLQEADDDFDLRLERSLHRLDVALRTYLPTATRNVAVRDIVFENLGRLETLHEYRADACPLPPTRNRSRGDAFDHAMAARDAAAAIIRRLIHNPPPPPPPEEMYIFRELVRGLFPLMALLPPCRPQWEWED